MAAHSTPHGLVRVRVVDRQTGRLVGVDGGEYLSPLQPIDDAMQLVRVLLLAAEAPAPSTGPWTRAIAGGQRRIELR